MRRALLVLIAACDVGGHPAPGSDPVPVLVPVPAPEPAPVPAPLPPGLVDVSARIPDAVIDLRYASSRNLTHAPLYPTSARCLLDARVADRLARAADAVRPQHLRLLLWDCYRPFAIQELLWARVHDPRYAAEPVRDARGHLLRGSVHSRAAAVDVSLAGDDGTPLAMPTDHDDFTDAAHRDRAAASPAFRALDGAMTAAGFRGIATEWWHYDAPGADALPLRDDPLR